MHMLRAALAAGMLATAPAWADGLAAGTYKIGFITENTGPIAFAGLSYDHGAQLAAAEISASGYMGAGTGLALVEKESASEPARAIQDMHQFIADRTVLATSCCILSGVVKSLTPIVLGAKIPLVVFGATAPGLPHPPLIYSVTILPGPKDTATAQRAADIIKPKTAAWFVAADNDAFKARMAAAQQAVEAMGVKTAGVVSVLSSDTDFTAPATQAMGLSPDMILIYTTQTPAEGIITALRSRGYDHPIVGNDVLSPQSVVQKMGKTVAGVPFPISFSAALAQTPEAKKFVGDYTARFGAAPDIYSAQGYAAVYMIAQAMKSLSGTPTRETLAAALAEVKQIDHNVYGGEIVTDGQAATQGTLIVAWQPDGTLAPWPAP